MHNGLNCNPSYFRVQTWLHIQMKLPYTTWAHCIFSSHLDCFLFFAASPLISWKEVDSTEATFIRANLYVLPGSNLHNNFPMSQSSSLRELLPPFYYLLLSLSLPLWATTCTCTLSLAIIILYLSFSSYSSFHLYEELHSYIITVAVLRN